MGQRIRQVIVGSVASATLLVLGSVGVAASHPGGHGGGGSTTSGSCSLSPATVGGPLTIYGAGFTAGAKYTLDVTWPYGGNGYLFATADSSGAWAVYTQADWAGTYSVAVLSSKGAVVATCSETVSAVATSQVIGTAEQSYTPSSTEASAAGLLIA
ncbi:MAG TPA: hypothetical protein VFR33_16240 [Candidatus Dormibacteraeota bacterium]|nr:hypothetical protein [Candidatus Dormibacteraeota bacterium]